MPEHPGLGAGASATTGCTRHGAGWSHEPWTVPWTVPTTDEGGLLHVCSGSSYGHACSRLAAAAMGSGWVALCHTSLRVNAAAACWGYPHTCVLVNVGGWCQCRLRVLSSRKSGWSPHQSVAICVRLSGWDLGLCLLYNKVHGRKPESH